MRSADGSSPRGVLKSPCKNSPNGHPHANGRLLCHCSSRQPPVGVAVEAQLRARKGALPANTSRADWQSQKTDTPPFRASASRREENWSRFTDTLGQYDFMVVTEMSDAKAASILAFVATGGGGIEGSVTTQAFTTAEARDMLAAAGKIAGDYKPMGAS